MDMNLKISNTKVLNNNKLGIWRRYRGRNVELETLIGYGIDVPRRFYTLHHTRGYIKIVIITHVRSNKVLYSWSA